MNGSQFIQVPGHDGPRDVWYETMYHSADCSTLFPLHEACLDIGRQAVIHHQLKHHPGVIQQELAVLVRLLNMRFTERHTRADVPDDSKNDLFGLCKWSNMYGPESVLAMNRLEWWGAEYEVSFQCASHK